MSMSHSPLNIEEVKVPSLLPLHKKLYLYTVYEVERYNLSKGLISKILGNRISCILEKSPPRVSCTACVHILHKESYYVSQFTMFSGGDIWELSKSVARVSSRRKRCGTEVQR